MQGTVKFFNEERFFGFIITEAGEFFYHGRSVIGPLPQKGDTVDFELGDDKIRGGLLALNVRAITCAPCAHIERLERA